MSLVTGYMCWRKCRRLSCTFHPEKSPSHSAFVGTDQSLKPATFVLFKVLMAAPTLPFPVGS